MLEKLFIIIVSGLESYIWLLMTKSLLKSKYKARYGYYMLVLLSAWLSIRSFITKYVTHMAINILLLVVTLFLVLLFTIILYEGTLFKKIFYTSIYLIFSAFTELLLILLSVVNHGKISNYFNGSLGGIIYSIIAKCLIILILHVIKSKLSFFIDLDKKYAKVIFAIIIVDVVLFSSIYMFYNNSKLELTVEWSFLLISVSILLISLYSIFVIFQILRSSKEMAENVLKMQDMQLKMEQNDTLSIIVNKLRGLRHDMNNHLSIIKGFVETGQYDMLNHYIEQMEVHVEDAQDYIVTDNVVLTSLLNNKMAVAKEAGIDFRTFITGIDFKLTDIELCSLFGNLIDNAIEAAKKVEENRYIELKIIKKNNGYQIICENTFIEQPVFVNHRLVTTKANSEIHGIGSKNILDIIHKNQGTINYQIDEYVFEVNIFIPFKKNASIGRR